ncbi:MAG: hypothetical protein KatS3mg130_1460 [Candidatus Sumerlaea sp.]|nr:MAG: hypothetical protein KatS3mg130_1460 [Candidatus Sumerlaea sp.]
MSACGSALIAIAYVAINWVLISERVYMAVWKHLGPDGQAPVTRWQRVGTPLRTLHHAVRLCKGAWVGALALSVCTQLLDCTMAYLVGCGLGLGLSFTQFCVYVPAVTLAALLPITFNGVGLRESVYLVLMERSGIAKDQAVGLSLVHFAFMLILALAGGIWHVLAPLNATSTPNAENTYASRFCLFRLAGPLTHGLPRMKNRQGFVASGPAYAMLMRAEAAISSPRLRHAGTRNKRSPQSGSPYSSPVMPSARHNFPGATAKRMSGGMRCSKIFAHLIKPQYWLKGAHENRLGLSNGTTHHIEAPIHPRK